MFHRIVYGMHARYMLAKPSNLFTLGIFLWAVMSLVIALAHPAHAHGRSGGWGHSRSSSGSHTHFSSAGTMGRMSTVRSSFGGSHPAYGKFKVGRIPHDGGIHISHQTIDGVSELFTYRLP